MNMVKGFFCGLNTVDLQFLINEYPASNTKTKALKKGIYAGGPATNAAVSFAHLGGEPVLYTGIGEHSMREFILNDLQTNRVSSFDFLKQQVAEPVFASVITSGENGDRTIISYLPEKQYDKIEPIHEEYLDEMDVVLLDGFFMKAALHVARLAKRKNIPVIYDGGSWKEGLQDIIQYIDYAVLSENFSLPGNLQGEDVVSYFHHQGVNNLEITHGEKHIEVYENGLSYPVGVPSVEAVDTLGAGDFFHGAFAYHLARGSSFASALSLAANTAAESCKYFGTRSWLNAGRYN
jgi:sugar/nucleoside kinase (ribokinase family)